MLPQGIQGCELKSIYVLPVNATHGQPCTSPTTKHVGLCSAALTRKHTFSENIVHDSNDTLLVIGISLVLANGYKPKFR